MTNIFFPVIKIIPQIFFKDFTCEQMDVSLNFPDIDLATLAKRLLDQVIANYPAEGIISTN